MLVSRANIVYWHNGLHGANNSDRKPIKLLLKTIQNYTIHEVYEVIGRDKTLRISGNRPQLRSRGLKKKKPEWMAHGNWNNAGALEHFLAFITKRLDELDGL